jgi:hypothetical protein
MSICIGMAVVFQIPTLVFFLAKMRLVTARLLWRNLKYAILAIFIVAAVLTPSSDPWNQIVFAMPMLALYLLSIAGVAGRSGGKGGVARRGAAQAGVRGVGARSGATKPLIAFSAANGRLQASRLAARGRSTLLQPGVFAFRLSENRRVGIRVFPQLEEIVVAGLRLGLVSGQRVRSA